MPTYGYECQKCGDKFEVFQRIDDKPLNKCEKCGGALKKVFFPVGIVFKGSGFYCNDSKKGSCTSSLPATDSKDSSSGGNGKAASPKEEASVT